MEKYSFKKRVVELVRPSIPVLLKEAEEESRKELEHDFELLAKEIYNMHQTDKLGISKYTLINPDGDKVIDFGNSKWLMN